MWFIVGSVAILVLIMGVALVSDIRQRNKVRRLNEHSGGRGVSDAFRHRQASGFVQGPPATNRGFLGMQSTPPPG